MPNSVKGTRNRQFPSFGFLGVMVSMGILYYCGRKSIRNIYVRCSVIMACLHKQRLGRAFPTFTASDE